MINYATTNAPEDAKRRMARILAGYGDEKTAGRYSRMAEAYQEAASSTAPVGHWTQAVARAAQGFTGGMYERMARDEQRAADERATAAAFAKEQRDSAAALAKEDREHQAAIELAKEKAAIEQAAPGYQADLAYKQAQTTDLSAKEAFRRKLLGMIGGEESAAAAPGAAAPAAGMPDAPNVGGPVPSPNPLGGNGPAQSGTTVPLQGVEPQSYQPTQDRCGFAERIAASGAVDPVEALNVTVPGTAVDGGPSAARARMARSLMSAEGVPSSDGGAQPSTGGPMPGVQLAADQSPQGSPPAPSSPGAQPDMIDTPMGRITRERARQLGGAMLMDPQYAPLGKALLDQAQAQNAPGLSQPTINTIQEKQFNTVEQYSRLKSIEQSWRPEYQQIENRLGFAWNNLMDKFGATRKSLTAAQRQELAAFHSNKSEALNNLNQYIKEITGAAMTTAEAVRIKNSMPNPGEGVFDGDSPTEFYAKLQSNIRISKMALARYNYLTRRGFKGDVEAMASEMPLEQMGSVIQGRTNELLKESLNANPGLTPQDVAPIVKQRLRAEFGIDA